jgi:penicillin-binding protein 1C
MQDDNQLSDSRDSHDQNPEDEQAESPSRLDRLDRLIKAQENEEKQAARWDEIEGSGQPVSGADQIEGGSTQPVGRAAQPDLSGEPPVPQETPPAAETGYKAPDDRPPAAFPHPTDSPAAFTTLIQSRSKTTGRLINPSAPHPTDQGIMAEPPQPTLTDADATRRGITPPGGQPHHRYQPPPEKAGPVRLDADGMPLPPNHQQSEPEASLTVASQRPSFDQPAQGFAPSGPEHLQRAGSPQAQFEQRAGRPSFRRPRFTWGCLGRSLMLGLVSALVLLMLGGGAASIYYAQVTAPAFANINGIADLQQRALQFETTRIRDRDGNILYELNDPQGGFRDYVTLDQVSPWVIVATVSTEERDFFTNPGFSVPAIGRAVFQNLMEGRAVSGASTITQQLTRALLLPEEERTQRSYERKIKEIFLASELGRRFTKREILELYLNQIYYGNLAYGIEAASRTYFNKSSHDLTFAEASFLAGLPQAPAVWDPVINKEGALGRQQSVIALMKEGGCLDTGDTGLTLPCTTDADIAAAQAGIVTLTNTTFHAPAIQAKYPHWVVYIQQLLEADKTIGPAIYTSGFDVYTTLDPRLQDLAQAKVELVLSGLTDRNVNNASVVVLDPKTGAILAMVGSRNFNDESIDGQVNVALTLQQPGSSIKPFTYLTAFRKGWNPSTMLWDVPIGYDIPGFGRYEPLNYDGKFHGPVTVRTALANSYNIPAVLALDYVGVPELLKTLNDFGITTLGDPSNPKNLGLSLTLGAGDVYLLDWADAYAAIANNGEWHPTYAIERIERNGQVIEGYPYQVPEGKRVISDEDAFLITSILSDTEARVPAFGRESVISPPYPAAAKTGTTNDYVDNWTMGFTTQMVVGVWVGNTDNSPMINVSGVTGAGPIWRGIMDGAQEWYPAGPFPRPSTIHEQTVCADDGALPSAYCQEHSDLRTDVFGPVAPPPAADKGLYQQLKVDQFTGLIANENCPDFVEDKFFVVLPNPSQLIDTRVFEQNWLTASEDGQAWATRRALPMDRFTIAPTEACKADTPKPTIMIDAPAPDSTQMGLVTVIGTVNAPNFSHYVVEFGVGNDPLGWGVLQAETHQTVQNGQLGQANLSAYDTGQMTIRVIVYDTQGHHAEKRVVFNFIKPTPTPAPTDMPTVTPQPTPTNFPTSTSEPSSTPADTPTPTPAPTDMPAPTATP